MSEYPIPQSYVPCLGLYDTQKAIGMIKQAFEVKLCAALHLKRVTAPLFVDPALGLNDDLNGVERPVSFDIPAAGVSAQVRLPPRQRPAHRHERHPPGRGTG